MPATRAEPGCVEYRLHRHDEQPGTSAFHELWRTDGDLDRHLATPHVVAFIAAIAPLLEARTRNRVARPRVARH